MGYLLIHWEPVYPRAQTQGYVLPQITMQIPPLLHYLLLHRELVYPRGQSQEYVLPPIPIQIPPLLQGLLTATLRTSIS
jgi:hypothetical protein